MASTTVPDSPELSLSDMPIEILQEIFWHSLELNLYAVSRQTFQWLPNNQLINQRKLVRFLLLLAFGSPQTTNKIIHNNGNDCSSILRKLPFIASLPSYNAYSLPAQDRLKLQQAIMNSGWFKPSSLVEVSRAHAEYLIQHMWTDQGIITNPSSVQTFTDRNVDKGARLQIEGLCPKGDFRRFIVDSFDVTLEIHDTPVDMDDIRDVDFVRLLNIRCIPNKLLKAPLRLPHANCNLWMDGWSMYETRLTHPIPDILHYLHEYQAHGEGKYNEDELLTVSSQAVTNAISEAIRRPNHCVLKALTALPLTADGTDVLKPLKPEHFIAAAQRLDQAGIELMWELGHEVFPFENDAVIAWMQHAETTNPSARFCPNIAFIDYIKSYKKEVAENGSPRDTMHWKHSALWRCKRTGEPWMW